MSKRRVNTKYFVLALSITLGIVCAIVKVAPWLVCSGYTRVGAEEYNSYRLRSTQPLQLHMNPIDSRSSYGELFVSDKSLLICIGSSEEDKAERILTDEQRARVGIIEEAFRAGWNHARAQDSAPISEQSSDVLEKWKEELWEQCWKRGVEANNQRR